MMFNNTPLWWFDKYGNQIPSNAYVTEDALDDYVTEDGLSVYVTES